MQEHEQRVVDEKNELELKCDKLTKFVNGESETYKNLYYEEKKLLSAQLHHMEEYLDILERRIARFE